MSVLKLTENEITWQFLDEAQTREAARACAVNRSSRSIATYYYTTYEGSQRLASKRTTTFEVRPGTTDQRDIKVQLRHLIRDTTPPIIERRLAALSNRKSPN